MSRSSGRLDFLVRNQDLAARVMWDEAVPNGAPPAQSSVAQPTVDEPTVDEPAAAGATTASARSSSLFDRPASQTQNYEQYRSLSGAAVASLVFGIISVAALLDFWSLKAIPVLGIVSAVAAMVRIRRQPDEFSGMKLAKLGLASSLAFLALGSGMSLYAYATEAPDGYERISYEMLKHPDESQRDSASPAALALDGKRIFIKGFMFPPPHEQGVTKFVLCRDNGDCCFGGQPPASDMIFVDLVDGLDTHYDRKLRHVAGTFRVAGSHSTDVNKAVLYRLDADYIK